MNANNTTPETNTTAASTETGNTASTGQTTPRNRKTFAIRTAAVVAGLGIAGTLAAAGVGAAHAGTLPVNHPGEPTVAMTITNHTDHTEFYAGGTPGSGQWINAPQFALAPGASEVVTASAPNASSETVFVNYQVGAFGPRAIYELENVRGDVNTNMTGTTGGHYFVNASVASGFPNANAVYDLW
ncbi:hypothetical protein [Gordonia jacobaea]|uniref:hypothetical protein n=2 Tax=Gordonia TaxID=2053 RepID=UPI003D75BA45